ncbi:MAG: type II secretion system protein [bacterium]|nr:type II secretion system protein [bacterium]
MKKGFTLIELLVVVAIIGLLSSIIFINTKNARFQAYDASIQSTMHQLRNEAEMIYTQNGESYTTICDESDGTLSNSGEIGAIEKKIKENNTGQNIVCIESADKKDFAAASPLRAQVGKYWCIESAGLSQELDNQITTARCQ